VRPAATGDRPVALVTGSSRGIGKHLVHHLVAAGYTVIGCSRTPPDWTLDHHAHHVVDVGDEKQVVALVRHIATTYHRLDAVLNNAGAASMNHILLTPVSTLEKLMRVNVTGTFLVSREAAKFMQKRRAGRIINFSSAVVPMRLAGEAAYVASKAAVEALSQTMAREVAEVGVTVNVIAPGPVATEMMRGVPKATLEKTLRWFAQPRLTTLEDVANAVDFLLAPGSSAITGQILYLNGSVKA
jgi:3-oxoacyl-[acyl-carrier protein] reductase